MIAAGSPLGSRAPALSPIPILILTDCEPDPREVPPDDPRPWLGFERFFDFMAAQRTKLAERTGQPARLNWFWRMDPQIELVYGSADWPVLAYARQTAEMARHGDGIGLHVHAWRFDAGIGRWIADHGNAPWIETCLRRSFAAFRAALGRDCEIVRFGDGWFDAGIIPLLEELGARIDLTVEPEVAGKMRLLSHEVTTGRIPDRRGVPRAPYHPSRADFRRPDGEGVTRLWELPVSTGALIKRSNLRHPIRLLRWRRSPKRHMLQFNIEIIAKRFPRVFDRVLAAAAPCYAAICVRSDVGTSEQRLSVVARNLDAILRHPLAERFRFVTPGEALALLTGEAATTSTAGFPDCRRQS